MFILAISSLDFPTRAPTRPAPPNYTCLPCTRSSRIFPFSLLWLSSIRHRSTSPQESGPIIIIVYGYTYSAQYCKTSISRTLINFAQVSCAIIYANLKKWKIAKKLVYFWKIVHFRTASRKNSCMNVFTLTFRVKYMHGPCLIYTREIHVAYHIDIIIL